MATPDPNNYRWRCTSTTITEIPDLISWCDEGHFRGFLHIAWLVESGMRVINQLVSQADIETVLSSPVGYGYDQFFPLGGSDQWENPTDGDEWFDLDLGPDPRNFSSGGPAWTQHFDNVDWTVDSYGSWNGTAWESTGEEIKIEANGWEAGYRPGKIRINFEGSESQVRIYLRDQSFNNIISQWVTDGEIVDLDFTGHSDIFNMYIIMYGSPGWLLTNIEFAEENISVSTNTSTDIHRGKPNNFASTALIGSVKVSDIDQNVIRNFSSTAFVSTIKVSDITQLLPCSLLVEPNDSFLSINDCRWEVDDVNGILSIKEFSTINFLDFAETDPNTDLTVAANDITVSTMRRDVVAGIQKDFGAGYFAGNFVFEWDVNYTAKIGSYPACSIFAMSMAANLTRDSRDNNNDGFDIYVDTGSSIQHFLRDWATPDDNDANSSFTSPKHLWYRLTRNGTTTTLLIFDTPGRTTPTDTLVITTAAQAYRYLTPISSMQSTFSGTDQISLTLSDMAVNLG